MAFYSGPATQEVEVHKDFYASDTKRRLRLAVREFPDGTRYYYEGGPGNETHVRTVKTMRDGTQHFYERTADGTFAHVGTERPAPE